MVTRGKTDEKGRIVIPKEMRQEHDEFLIFGLPGGIFLKPIKKIEDPLSDLKEVAIDTDKTVLEIKRKIREALGKGVTKSVRRH
jgi:bifunctional DNA-binding transcriptional regulator/antitoxin component of YhaV-PrlF toxin-antitoxin module